jgi:hypothetical protein
MQWIFKALPYQATLSINRSVAGNSGLRMAARLQQRTEKPSTLSEGTDRSAAAAH